MKILLINFHLNGHTSGFHPQTQTNLVQHSKQHHRKVLLSSFHLIGMFPQKLFVTVIFSQEPSQRDYTLFTKLHGPPRTNDKIAYKVSIYSQFTQFYDLFVFERFLSNLVLKFILFRSQLCIFQNVLSCCFFSLFFFLKFFYAFYMYALDYKS